MAELGPFLKQHSSRYFAVTGRWPECLHLVLKGDEIPQDLRENAQRLRAIYLREQDRKSLLEEIEELGKVKSTISWTNELGEECLVEGFLQNNPPEFFRVKGQP